MCEAEPMLDSSPRSGAQSVERALAVLASFEGVGGDLGVSEIASRTGLTVSTAHRLVRALCDAGLLSQNPATDRYQLGPTLVVLGRQAERHLGYDQALPLLETLAARTAESVNLGIAAGTEVLVVLDVASNLPLRFDQLSGSRVPIHTSAMGKCLLAWSPAGIDAAVAALGELPGVTTRTITDPRRLRNELHAVKARGWALNDEERNPGVRAIAAPVLAPGGTGAAIAVQGPAIRLTDEHLATVAAAIQETARRIAPLLAISRR
jgi:DNA-binding IclR family transcriptional regulator